MHLIVLEKLLLLLSSQFRSQMIVFLTAILAVKRNSTVTNQKLVIKSYRKSTTKYVQSLCNQWRLRIDVALCI